MLTTFLILAFAAVIVVAAIRIILGWILPVRTVQGIDRFVNRAGVIYLKLCVIGLAGLIVWLSYVAMTAP